jgi:hypothetical protein
MLHHNNPDIDDEHVTWALYICTFEGGGYYFAGHYIGLSVREDMDSILSFDKDITDWQWYEDAPAITRWVQHVLQRGYWVNDEQTFILKEPGRFFAQVLLTRAQALEAAKGFKINKLKGVKVE